MHFGPRKKLLEEANMQAYFFWSEYASLKQQPLYMHLV